MAILTAKQGFFTACNLKLATRHAEPVIYSDMDFIWAILFFLWFECLSLPLRGAIVRWPMPADVRRLLSRVAGPAMLLLPIWLLAFVCGWALERWIGWVWLALTLALIGWTGRTANRPWQWFAYGDGEAAPARRALSREIWIDALTLGLFLGYVALRRWFPEFTTWEVNTSGAEKFPNAMIFWSNWFAHGMPPDDYWLTGHPLVYYYWGHFHWAWIGRVGGFPAELALNLSLARLTVLVWESVYVLGRALGLRAIGAAGAALASTWAGNPKAIEVAWKLIHPAANHWEWPPKLQFYKFWDPSRAIHPDWVVDEFPAFSSILGDFHSHQIALPWLVAWLALCVAGIGMSGWGKNGANRVEAASGPRRRTIGWTLLWIGLALVAALTNLWNLPLLGFAALCVAVSLVAKRQWKMLGYSLVATVLMLAIVKLGMGLMRAGAPLPLPSNPNAGFWERQPWGWLDPKIRSTFVGLFAMWGLPLLGLAVAALWSVIRRRAWRPAIWLTAGVMVLLTSIFTAETLWGGPAWFWVGVMLVMISLAVGERPWLTQRALWMALAGCVVLAGLEVVYIRDRFQGSDLARYNTYFKLCYPVWPVLIVAVWMAGVRVWQCETRWWWRWTGRVILLALVAGGAVYPLCSFPARILQSRHGDRPRRPPTLSGHDFLAYRPAYKNEARMIELIRQVVPPGDIVAEAHTEKAYSLTGRVASLAGRPVPLGWVHHEQQWRGEPGYATLRKRGATVDRLYRAPNPEAMRARAKELKVRWVLFGKIESERYGQESLQRLRAVGRLAARFPETRPEVFLFDFR